MRAVAWLLLTTSLVLPAPLRSQQSPLPELITRADTFAVRDARLPVEVGHFTVPANRRTGSSRLITLGFVRFRSTAKKPGPPIVFLAGGPGDAATRAFQGMPASQLAELRSIADVIAFDQRGTGMSEPHGVRCQPQPPQPRDHPGDPDELLAGLRGALRTCLDSARNHGVDVMGLTTAESADDIAALARALNTGRVSLLAGSYGTHLALAAMRQHPALVARTVLVGVEGPDDTFKLPARVDSVLGTIAAGRSPSLLQDLRTLRDQLTASPARFTFPGGQIIVLGAWDLQRWVAGALGSRRDINAMLEGVARMKDGDYGALARWTLRQRFPPPLNLMHVAMDCASAASAERMARIRRETPGALLGNVLNFPASGLCDLPGLPKLPDGFRAPLVTDAPVLLIAGTFDGRTPVQNARELARTMPEASILVVDGASHDLFGEPAVMSATVRFLRE